MNWYEGIPLSEACPRNGGPPSKPLWFIGLLDSEPEASCLQNAWNRSTIVWPCLTNARNVFSQFSPISVSTKESAIKLSGPSTWHSISRASVNVKLQWLQWLPATSGRVGTFYLFELKFELWGLSKQHAHSWKHYQPPSLQFTGAMEACHAMPCSPSRVSSSSKPEAAPPYTSFYFIPL